MTLTIERVKTKSTDEGCSMTKVMVRHGKATLHYGDPNDGWEVFERALRRRVTDAERRKYCDTGFLRVDARSSRARPTLIGDSRRPECC